MLDGTNIVKKNEKQAGWEKFFSLHRKRKNIN